MSPFRGSAAARVAALAAALISATVALAERSVTVFVAIDGRPSAADVERKLDSLRAAGVDSFMFYPTSGMRMEYLGEEFWRCAIRFAEGAERRGMKMWLYDEYNWPSGSCRGRVPAEEEAFRLTEIAVRRDAAGKFVWEKALGPKGWVNLLEPRAVRRFIERTHLEYERRLGKWMKSGTIPGFFTDEPGHPASIRTPDGTLAHCRWYDGLEADYASATGRDFRRDVEAWTRGDRTNGVWAAYAKIYGRRFRSSYYDQVRSELDRMGLKLCGHLIYDDDPANAVMYNGDPLLALAGESLPGIDEILSHDRPENVPFFLYALADYATRKGGKGGMAELFACGPTDMPLDRVRRMIRLCALHGVTRYFTVMSVMDASWLDKMRCGFTVTVGEFQPWFAEFPSVLDEADRASAVARKRPIRDVAVRMPQRALSRVIEDADAGRRVGGALNALLAEIELSGYTPMLIAEDERCDGLPVLTVDGEGAIRRENDGAEFASAAAAAASVAQSVTDGIARRRNVLLRRYADGTREELDLNPPVAGISGGRPIEGDWELRLPRPVALRVPFSTNRAAKVEFAEPLEVKVVARRHLPVPKEEDDDMVEGAPMCAGDGVNGPPPYAFSLDGERIVAENPTDDLPEGYSSLYRESEARMLDAGPHEFAIASGRDDELHFLPNLFVTGDFIATAKGLAKRPSRVRTGPLADVGLGGYAGRADYLKEVDVPADAETLTADTGLAVARVTLGGRDLGARLWPPFEWSVPADLRGRKLVLEVAVYTSQLPLFGPPLPGQGLGPWLPRSDADARPGLVSAGFR